MFPRFKNLNWFIPLAVIALLLGGCSNKMHSENSAPAKTVNKKKEGSIVYPDGSVRTADGTVWPAGTAKPIKKSSATTTSTTVAKKTSSKTTQTVSKNVNPSSDEDMVAINTTRAGDRVKFPDAQTTEPASKKAPINTSAKKDATGRHMRKRGEPLVVMNDE